MQPDSGEQAPKESIDPVAGPARQALSEAFLSEFGKQPIGIERLQGSSSPAARLVAGHFDQVANLEARRDGWASFSQPPKTVSYGDLKEMEKLADAKLGLQNHYSQEDLASMESWNVGWAKVYGVGAGVAAGGILRFTAPILRGRSAAVTAGVVALGALAGYKAGEFLGQKSFDDFAEESNYLSVEKQAYGDALGRAWQDNTKWAGTAGIFGGFVAAAGLGALRVGVGLGVAGVVTYLMHPLAYNMGYRSATREMDNEAALGRLLEREWKSAQ